MKSWFYMRTAYRILNDCLPNCFVELDNALAPYLLTADDLHLHPAVRQGELLCRRMGCVDFYSVELASKLIDEDTGDASIEAEMLLVGYMSSCKAVLDAAAIVLTQLYSLDLKPKQQDLRLATFWKALRSRDEEAARRHAQWNSLVNEQIVPWRDMVIHRETPIVLPGSDNLPLVGTIASNIALANDHQADVAELFHHPERFTWVDPLHFHREWRGSLVAMCKEVCKDIGRLPEIQP